MKDSALRPLRERQFQLTELEIIKANKATEELRHKNLELEKAVSPRVLEQKLSAEALKPFAGTKYVLISPNDFEMRRTAGQIRHLLRAADWVEQKDDIPVQPWIRAGVHVSYKLQLRKGDVSEAAAELVKQLKLSIDADGGITGRMPPDVVLIEVGPTPLPETMQPQDSDFPSDDRGGKSYGNVDEQ